MIKGEVPTLDSRFVTKLSATRKGSGESAALDLLLQNEGRLGEGNIGSVRRLKLDRGEGKEPLYLAYKTFYSGKPSQSAIDNAMEIQSRMLHSPHGREYAVGTLRYTEKGLLMTDLSEGGKNLVISSNDPENEINREARLIDKKNPEFIQNFIDSMGFFPEEKEMEFDENFRKKAKLIARETSEAHIWLEGDCTFFVVYPDGSYKLHIVDLDNAKIKDDSSPDSIYSHNLQKIMSLKSFVSNLWFTLRRY